MKSIESLERMYAQPYYDPDGLWLCCWDDYGNGQFSCTGGNLDFCIGELSGQILSGLKKFRKRNRLAIARAKCLGYGAIYGDINENLVGSDEEYIWAITYEGGSVPDSELYL
jgi:hypothetical protein